MKKRSRILGFLLSIIIPIIIGAIIIAATGHDPLHIYAELLKGAFVGKLSLGTTLEKFTSVLLLGLAFSLSTQVGFFNLGLEGCVYMGAIFSAFVGFSFTGLPKAIHLPLCVIVGALAGAIWIFIPAYAKLKYNASELCSAIMLNYVAIYFVSYMINYVWTARTSAPQTPPNAETARFTKLLLPSRANTSIFLAIAVFIIVFVLLKHTLVGRKITWVGHNRAFADYVGFNSTAITMITVLCSGAIGGMVGAIEIAGNYGTVYDKFAGTLIFDGLMASLVVRNNMKFIPISAFFIAAMKAGSLGMEQNTAVSRALVDTIVTVLILLVAMDNLFNFTKIHKAKKNQVTVLTEEEMQARLSADKEASKS